MSEANPSPAFAAPGNPDKSILGGDNSQNPSPAFAAPGNGSVGLPSAAGDPMGEPRCVPYAPTPDEVKSMFGGG
jgi:hypothetical protein